MNSSSPPLRTSKTALGVALQRVVHQLLDGDPKILLDPVAAQLFGDGVNDLLLSRAAQIYKPEVAGLRAHVVLRSRFAEDRLAEAVRSGVQQLVILGAGFDTFAYRQPAWAQGLRIFEVDQAATQLDKQQRLQRAGIPIPENLEFVAIDFESSSLHDGLRASSLDFSQPTFFSCLGVLMYLSEAAVEATFRLVASFPPGSEIAFTFSTAESADSEIAHRARALGEPWQSHFEPDELMRRLRGMGYSEVSLLSVDEARNRYFANRDDALRAPQRSNIAAARV